MDVSKEGWLNDSDYWGRFGLRRSLYLALAGLEILLVDTFNS